MERRTLGTSNLHISSIGLGGMSLPTNVEEARSIIEAALAAGINYFDTADLYNKGINEEIMGTLLKPYRNDIILATKVGNRWTEGEEGWHWDPSKSHIEKAVKESLRRLQTDTIDLYQLHGGTIDDPWDEIINTFEGLKKEGLIREYGISSIRPNVLKRFLPNSDAVSVMMQYSMLDRRSEEWFDYIKEQRASVVTRGTLAKGLLTHHWKERAQRAGGYINYAVDELINVLGQLDASYEDIHALALAFNLANPAVASTVIGASSVTQLEESIAAYHRISKIGDLQQALALTKADIYKEHRD